MAIRAEPPIELIALDLDGTLSRHRTAVEAHVLNLLRQLHREFRLVLVCAGSCTRVRRQLGADFIDIIGNYGLEFYSAETGAVSRERIDEATTLPGEQVADRINILRSRHGYQQYAGASVEFHESGVITFPLLGVAAPLAHKLTFDPDRIRRRLIHADVAKMFSEYNVFIGGSSSFDLVPRPHGKAHALERYLAAHAIPGERTIYFGDDFGAGGNDAPIVEAGFRYIEVDRYESFPELVRHETGMDWSAAGPAPCTFDAG